MEVFRMTGLSRIVTSPRFRVFLCPLGRMYDDSYLLTSRPDAKKGSGSSDYSDPDFPLPISEDTTADFENAFRDRQATRVELASVGVRSLGSI